MRLFRRAARPAVGEQADVLFRVRVTLCKGDRLVYRDAGGTVRSVQATEPHVEVADAGIGPRPATGNGRRRRPAALSRWIRATTAGAFA